RKPGARASGGRGLPAWDGILIYRSRQSGRSSRSDEGRCESRRRAQNVLRIDGIYGEGSGRAPDHLRPVRKAVAQLAILMRTGVRGSGGGLVVPFPSTFSPAPARPSSSNVFDVSGTSSFPSFTIPRARISVEPGVNPTRLIASHT